MRLSLTMLTLTACVRPTEPQYVSADGNIPVVITNFSREPLCFLELEPDTAKMGHVTPLELARQGDQVHPELPPVRPGQTVRANVKPGSYMIHAQNCTKSMLTNHQADDFDVAGPTAVGISGEDRSAPPNFRRITLELHNPHESGVGARPADCWLAGTPVKNPADQPRCCSGMISCPNGECFRATCE